MYMFTDFDGLHHKLDIGPETIEKPLLIFYNSNSDIGYDW